MSKTTWKYTGPRDHQLPDHHDKSEMANEMSSTASTGIAPILGYVLITSLSNTADRWYSGKSSLGVVSGVAIRSGVAAVLLALFRFASTPKAKTLSWSKIAHVWPLLMLVAFNAVISAYLDAFADIPFRLGMTVLVNLLLTPLLQSPSPSRWVTMSAVIVASGVTLDVGTSISLEQPGAMLGYTLIGANALCMGYASFLVKNALVVLNQDVVELAFYSTLATSILISPLAVLSGEKLGSSGLLDAVDWWTVTVLTGLLAGLTSVMAALSLQVVSPLSFAVAAAGQGVFQISLSALFFASHAGSIRTMAVVIVTMGSGRYIATRVKDTEAMVLYSHWSLRAWQRNATLALVMIAAGALAFVSTRTAASELAIAGPLSAKESIQASIARADALSEQLVRRQSKSVSQALVEYRRRYKREPPPGYAAWVQFALAHSSPIIDDYDQLEANLEPFRQLSCKQIQNVVASSDARSLAFFGGIKVVDGVVSIYGEAAEHDYRKTMYEILEPLNHTSGLPDMELFVNWDDRSKVLPDVKALNGSVDVRFKGFSAETMGVKHRELCPTNFIADSEASRDRPSLDLCRPESDAGMLGYFLDAAGLFNGLMPIVSWGKTSAQADILAPMACYGSAKFRLWKDGFEDTPFEDKLNRIYWRGSPTGFVPRPKTWRQGHRQKLVRMSQLSKKYQTAVQTGAVLEAARLGSELDRWFGHVDHDAIERLPSDMFDMNFSRTSFCNYHNDSAQACQELVAELPLVANSPSTDAYNNRFVFDLDGNTISCRYYALLESNSLVFKQTGYAEWHDDRMIPWKHYVPVSLKLEELPELLDYFANDVQGQRDAERIAYAGKDWAGRTLRKVDLTVFYYRLLLEYGHIQSGCVMP